MHTILTGFLKTLHKNQPKVEIFKNAIRYYKHRKKDAKQTRERNLELNELYKKTHARWGKIALLMGYNGRNYCGMQRSYKENIKTIEGELVQALNKAGVLSADEVSNPALIAFQRTSRTDTRVSAMKQVVSFKIEVPIIENFIDVVNSHLPPDIRVFGYKKVWNSFYSKWACNARTYSYVLPTFALTPIEQLTLENYRLTNDVWELTNDLLQDFKGVHNFYNFTNHRLPSDESSVRRIIDIQCSVPFVVNNLELLTVTIKGESFMMHQIRKMIGMVIVIVRGLVPLDFFEKCWEPERMHVPRAPGNGLFLTEQHFDRYNEDIGHGDYEPLLWNEHQKAIYSFYQEYILPSIVQVEKNERSMLKWLEHLYYYQWDKDLVQLEKTTSVLGILHSMFKPVKEEEIEDDELFYEES